MVMAQRGTPGAVTTLVSEWREPSAVPRGLTPPLRAPALGLKFGSAQLSAVNSNLPSL